MLMNTLHLHVTITAATVSVFLVVAAYFYFNNKKKPVVISDHWIAVGNVTKICIYPLKSGRRLEVNNADCTTYGLKTADENELQLRDRSFVIYGETNFEFKTARTYPKLVLIETSVHDRDHVVFDAPNQRPLYVKVPTEDTNNIQITLHAHEKIDGLDCGNEAALWFSRYVLDKPSGLRLAYHDGKFKRDINAVSKKELKAFTRLDSESMGMYSDLSSYLLINQSSIDNLNKNLEQSITANNFRPNIVMEGLDLPPFSEEDWDWVKIGTVIFRNVKPCTRCVMITVDPERGLMTPSREPLRSLERLNILKDPIQLERAGKAPVMGINMGLKTFGRIALRDKVYISKGYR